MQTDFFNCPCCGMTNQQDATFCKQCGAALQKPSANAGIPAAQQFSMKSASRGSSSGLKAAYPVSRSYTVISWVFPVMAGVILFGLLCALVGVMVAKNIFTPEVIKAAISGVDFNANVISADAYRSIVGDSNSETSSRTRAVKSSNRTATNSVPEEGYSLSDVIYASLSAEAKADLAIYGVTQESIGGILEESTLSDYVAEKVCTYSDALLYGGEAAVIDKQEIVQLIQENEDVIYANTGYRMTAQDYQNIEQTLEDTGALEGLSLDNLLPHTKESAVKVAGITGAFASNAAIAVLVVLVAVCLFVILFLNRHTLSRGFGIAGFVFTFSGVALQTGFYALTNWILVGTVLLAIPAEISVPLLRPIQYLGLLYGFLMTVVGILFIVASVVFITVRKSRRMDKAIA